MIYYHLARLYRDENSRKMAMIPIHDMYEFCEKFNVAPDYHGHTKDFLNLSGYFRFHHEYSFDHLQTFKKNNHKGRFGRVLTCSIYSDVDKCKEDFKEYVQRLSAKWDVHFYRASDVNVYFMGLYQSRFGEPLEYWEKYRQRDLANKTTIVFIEKDKTKVEVIPTKKTEKLK